jgi:pilus assembly protein Flp/PilA
MRYTNTLILRTMARAKAVSATREEGASAVEYGLLVALIAATIIATVGIIGDNLLAAFDEVAAELPDAF